MPFASKETGDIRGWERGPIATKWSREFGKRQQAPWHIGTGIPCGAGSFVPTGRAGSAGSPPLSPGRNVTRASQPGGDHLPGTQPRFFGMINCTQVGAVRNTTCHLLLRLTSADYSCWTSPCPQKGPRVLWLVTYCTKRHRYNENKHKRGEEGPGRSQSEPELPSCTGKPRVLFDGLTYGVTNVQHATRRLRGQVLKCEVSMGVRNAPTTVKYPCTPVT